MVELFDDQLEVPTSYVIKCIKAGCTPARLEAAYVNHTIRQLAKECRLNQKELTLLKMRWGIRPGMSSSKKYREAIQANWRRKSNGES